MQDFDFEQVLQTCNLCPLQGMNYALPRIKRGSGSKVMFVGEAPGENEAEKHVSFVGASGKLLDQWIKKMEIDNYFITNVVKHRPILVVNGKTYNRNPYPKEISSCSFYLYSEIEGENPDYIIALGKTARDIFLDTELPITKTVETTINMPSFYNGIRVFVLFHPSYILRSHTNIDNYLNTIRNIIGGEILDTI